jgi:hypothetical protein
MHNAVATENRLSQIMCSIPFPSSTAVEIEASMQTNFADSEPLHWAYHQYSLSLFNSTRNRK